MRVMFAVWPAIAHLYPSVTLAWALKAAGHEVCVVSGPAVAKAVTDAGLTAVSLGDDLPETVGAGSAELRALAAERYGDLSEALGLTDPEEAYPWEFFRNFMLPCTWNFHPADPATAVDASGVQNLIRLAQGWRPDLVIWEPCWPSAAVAARACGAAHARLLWGHDMFAWTYDRWVQRRETGVPLGEDPLTGYVRPVAEPYGFEVDDELLFGQWTIDPTPAGMRLPTTRSAVSMRWEPYNGAAVMPEWLYDRPDRPRIAFCLGASMRQFGKGAEDLARAIHSLINDMFDMVADLDVEMVATLNDAQLEGVTRVPDNVRIIEYIPLDLLLPTCSAFIHHGGVGTWAAAIPFQVPQIVPVEMWGIESPVTGPYMAARGAGIALNRAEQSVDDMRKQLVQVLEDPSYRQGAARVHQEWLSMPSPHDVVPILERLTAHHRARA
ncbi:nucleotide disphospho-sugar-binding domain-containing protein [Micromonospora sp. NPDC023644]|uniref:nucleotide disphospho-sugar-binding domain-containing protein n=1 Tax=Micromonospora sp. NPDC023644 TaxID=3154321 RepID=UPI0033C313C5